MLLASGKSSRLYQRLVFDKKLAQSVSAQQESLMLGSVFEIEVTARPGHTAEEMEKAIDEELEALRRDGPTQAEIERARNGIETRSIQGLERLGGIGGVADRLNMYNQLPGDAGLLRPGPGALRESHARVDPAVRAAAARRSRPRHRLRCAGDARPGHARADAEAGCGGPGPEGGRAGERRRPVARGRANPRPAAAAGGQHADLVHARQRIDGDPEPAAGAAPGGRQPGDPHGQRREPGRSPRPRELHGGDAGRGDGEPVGALQLADDVAQLGARLATGSTMDVTRVSVSSLEKTFPQALELLADVALHPAIPAEEVERQRKRAAGEPRPAAREPVGRGQRA